MIRITISNNNIIEIKHLHKDTDLPSGPYVRSNEYISQITNQPLLSCYNKENKLEIYYNKTDIYVPLSLGPIDLEKSVPDRDPNITKIIIEGEDK